MVVSASTERSSGTGSATDTARRPGMPDGGGRVAPEVAAGARADISVGNMADKVEGARLSMSSPCRSGSICLSASTRGAGPSALRGPRSVAAESSASRGRRARLAASR
eukprot:scaffold229415_cov29-Tisochrysis_lutea.AAC.1